MAERTEPIVKTEADLYGGISEAINRWLKEYTKPGSNGISEADKAYLAHLYTPQDRIVAELERLLNDD